MDEHRLARLARALDRRRRILEGRMARAAREAAASADAMRELEHSMSRPLFEVLGLWQPSLRRMVELDEGRRSAEAAKARLTRDLAKVTGLQRRISSARDEARAMAERKAGMNTILELLEHARSGKAAASHAWLGSRHKAR